MAFYIAEMQNGIYDTVQRHKEICNKRDDVPRFEKFYPPVIYDLTWGQAVTNSYMLYLNVDSKVIFMNSYRPPKTPGKQDLVNKI